MSALTELVEVVPPYEGARRVTVNWSLVERELRSALPEDYKKLVETYGPGEFDGHIRVLIPYAGNVNIDLLAQNTAAMTGLRSLRARSEDDLDMGFMNVPYDLTEGDEELILWAITEGSHNCYWVKSNHDADRWTVVMNDGSPDWLAFDGSMSEFLLAALTRKLNLTPRLEGYFFPSDFPSPRPTFSPDG